MPGDEEMTLAQKQAREIQELYEQMTEATVPSKNSLSRQMEEASRTVPEELEISAVDRENEEFEMEVEDLRRWLAEARGMSRHR